VTVMIDLSPRTTDAAPLSDRLDRWLASREADLVTFRRHLHAHRSRRTTSSRPRPWSSVS
jgi:hypothetical protein